MPLWSGEAGGTTAGSRGKLLRNKRTGVAPASRTSRGTASFQCGGTGRIARQPRSPVLGSDLFSRTPTMDWATLRCHRSAWLEPLPALRGNGETRRSLDPAGAQFSNPWSAEDGKVIPLYRRNAILVQVERRPKKMGRRPAFIERTLN